jgi:hypothetical protein
MKPIIKMALFMVLTSAIILPVHAGAVTTTKTTTTVTTTSTCKMAHHKKYKKHRHHVRYRTYYTSPCEDYSWNDCPGNADDCYYDSRGTHMRQIGYPIEYQHNVNYECLDSDNPASCSN